MERSAFARAKAFLAYTSRAKGFAILAAIGAGVFYVFLVLLLALLVDLLVTRGRVPTFAQLSDPQQERFGEVWKNLPEEARVQAIHHVGLGGFDADSKPPTVNSKTDEKRRFGLWAALSSTDSKTPIPGRMTAKGLKDWADAEKLVDDPYLRAMEENELRWRAYVWNYLKDHVGADAANSYQPKIDPDDPLPVPGIGQIDQSPHGALSLAVRLRGTFAGKILNAVAAISPWMWEAGRARDPNRTYLTGLLIIAIFAAFLRSVCIVVMNLLAASATIDAVTRMRRAVYHQASRLGDLSGNANGDGGNLLFTKHIEAIHEALYLWLMMSFRYSTQVILLLGLALAVQPWLTLAIVLFALLVWLMGGQIVAAFRRQGRSASRAAASRLVLLLESVRMMRLVKSYLMELFNQARVERQLSEYSKFHQMRYRGESVAKPVLVLLVTLAGISLLFLAGRIVLNNGLTLAGSSILVVAVAGLFLPVRSAIDLKRYTRRGRESAALLFDFLDRKGGNPQYADAEFLQPLSKSLEFKDVRFQEPDSSQPLLVDINLVVQAGEKIGLMGADESAKKAILHLIPRFFDPSEGEVRIDGRNLRWVSHESLRSQIGLVMNDRLIFSDTISTNIGCGDPSASTPQIIEAAKLAHAHQFIQRLPYGYETPIGEFGHALRIGEQFRIALARAILRDPTIYIIEEPTEQLDDDTKSLLDDTFDRIFPGKTVILLPHRVSTLRHCDRIVLLHNGAIEAIGQHRDLVHASNLYKHLYYLEFNAFADQT